MVFVWYRVEGDYVGLGEIRWFEYVWLKYGKVW